MFLSPSRISFALLATALALPAFAEPPAYNQVSLRAEVNREVARDRMQVTLYHEAQHEDPAQLAAETTRTLNQALTRARQVREVAMSLGSRSSYPIHDQQGQAITGWRERAELRLESTDFAALSRLVGELMQQDLQMGGMQFSVSDAIRQENEDALLKDAVAAFRARAQLATEALGGSGYRLVSLDLGNTGGYQPVMMRGLMKTDRLEAMATPEVEAGTQQITVTANGVIEVEMP